MTKKRSLIVFPGLFFPGSIFPASNLPTVFLLALPIVCSLCSIQPQFTFAAVPASASAQLDAVEKRLEKDEIAEDVYEQLGAIIEKDPTNYRAHLYLGNCYAKLGLPEQAIDELKLATEYGPTQPKAFVELVKAQIKMGQVPAAMELLAAAKKKFPNDPEVLFWSGNFLQQKGRWEEAETAYIMALSQKKKILGLPSARAEIKLLQGDFAQAKVLAQADLAIDPNFAMANRIYGLALASTGHFEQSIAPLMKAYEQQPFKQGLAENLAACAAWAGKWDIAMEPAIIALGATASLDANNPKEKARLYEIFRHSKPAAIERAVMSATIKAGKHPPGAFFFALGDVLDSVNMRALAIAQYKRGLQEEPAFGRAWFRLGKDLEIYAKDYPEALKCYQKAHAFRMQDKEIAMAMYSLSDKMAKRNLDWSWKIKDALKPPKKVEPMPEPETTASASTTR